jgi:hypothetical protein
MRDSPSTPAIDFADLVRTLAPDRKGACVLGETGSHCIRSEVRRSEARKEEALLTYQRSIQNAFHEVSDALIGHTKTADQRAQQERFVEALRETDRLSRTRF